MSHLSKIKTNISNIEILKQSLTEMGFYYSLEESLKKNHNHYLNVYASDIQSLKKIICCFEYDGLNYSLVTDIQLWNMGIQFDSFYEKLKQRYACNIILNQSNSNGFSKVSEKIMADGSVSVLVQRWI
uniref:Uncharacterized protein ycf35 n=1 Tax=Spermothamnion repens TaxID=31383 RepID=A0A4D6WYR8_9FLOR|nr:hypothetical protein [Spermothamnion repens]